jgi:fumarate reductase subunit C
MSFGNVDLRVRPDPARAPGRTIRNASRSAPRDTRPLAERRAEARRQLAYEIVSGASGAALAVFMWGHMFLVGSILTGARGFDFVSQSLEHAFIAQPTVVAISALFLIHAVLASRKIPAQLRERRRMRDLSQDLRARPGSAALRFAPHLESWIWMWQVRTGMVVLVLGGFHLVLISLDLFSGLFGERVGIEVVSTQARVGAGLWPVYGVLLVCVEFHAGAGLYRLAVKWGAGSRLSRRTLWRIEKVVFAVFVGLGLLTLVVLAGWLEPPLVFLTGEAA